MKNKGTMPAFSVSPRDLLWSMKRIRLVEEEIAKRYHEQEMRCPVHLSVGQEASAVGVCAALRQSDWVFSGHRNHAHYLAKGGCLKAMIAEIYGKASGCCGGRGGSMHLTDNRAGFVGATPIVGSTVPIAVGAALTAQTEGNSRVVVVFLGDGAMETGVVSESLSFASLKKLPILFVCENNLYSVYSPLEVRQPENRSISELASAHGMKTYQGDGNDAIEVYRVARDAIGEMRSGTGPVFIELSTYRLLEHCGPNYDNNIGYRTESEFLEWKKRDPLDLCSRKASITLNGDEIGGIEKEIKEAFSAAIDEPFPDPSSVALHVYASSGSHQSPIDSSSQEITYAEAIREAQEICLGRYEKSYLMGLGVPDPKGIFGTTKGLQEEFGSQRVFDIPIAENAITGIAIGSAITGMRPILTHQRLDFALVSIDQIVNQAAKWHYMFNGTMKVPLVIRMILGRGWGQGPQHSQSLHAWFAHIPGLKVIVPSSPFEAKGMLIAAVEDENPVLIMEHRWLHQMKGSVPRGYYSLDLEGCKVLEEGKDVTIISHGHGVNEIRAARRELRNYDVIAEIIDIRSINPLDEKTIIQSVQKTGRLIVVDDAESTCGISAEVITRVTTELGGEMKSRPVRLTFPPYPCPTSHFLSKNYYTRSADIVKASLEQQHRGEEYQPPTENGEIPHDQPNISYLGPF